MMRLRFTKGSGKFDRLEVMRDGLPPELIDCPKQRIIPHDMVHHAVESVMAARGFLGHLADGAAPMLRPGDAAAESIERLVEVIQGDAWSGPVPAPAAEMIDLYRVTCEARGSAVLPLDAATVEAIRARVAELTAQWEAVPVGGTLDIGFTR